MSLAYVYTERVIECAGHRMANWNIWGDLIIRLRYGVFGLNRARLKRCCAAIPGYVRPPSLRPFSNSWLLMLSLRTGQRHRFRNCLHLPAKTYLNTWCLRSFYPWRICR